MVYHLTASPPDRKRVMPVSKVGSPLNSSLRLSLTCFLGLSSARKGVLLCCTLLLDSWVLPCSFKPHIWRHSHLLGKTRPWGMMKGIAFGLLARDLGATLICSCPMIRNVVSVIQIIPLESLPLAIWWPLLFMVPQRVSEFAKLNSPRSVFYTLRVSLNLVSPVGLP